MNNTTTTVIKYSVRLRIAEKLSAVNNFASRQKKHSVQGASK